MIRVFESFILSKGTNAFNGRFKRSADKEVVKSSRSAEVRSLERGGILFMEPKGLIIGMALCACVVT